MLRDFINSQLLNADTGATGTGETGGTPENTPETPKSFDEILKADKNYQSEFDRRVSKALETSKAKWEQEYSAKIEEAKTEAQKLAKMNADEKAKFEQDKRIKALEAREQEITTRELKAQAYETLASKNLPKDLVDILNYSNAESCNKSIESVEKAFQTAVEKAVNDKLRGQEVPKGGQGGVSNGFNFNFTPIHKK